MFFRFQPFGVKDARFVDSLVGMRAKEIALRLEEIRRQTRRAVRVVERERRRKRRFEAGGSGGTGATSTNRNHPSLQHRKEGVDRSGFDFVQKGSPRDQGEPRRQRLARRGASDLGRRSKKQIDHFHQGSTGQHEHEWKHCDDNR